MTHSPEFRFIPVTTTAAMEELFDITEEQGLAPWVFGDTVLSAMDGFVQVMRKAHLYTCTNQDDLLGYTWLDEFRGTSAKVHLCVFRSAAPMALEATKEFCRFVLHGSYVETLIAVTPRQYRHARALATRVGFRHFGVVPGGAWLKRGIKADAHYQLLREEWLTQ